MHFLVLWKIGSINAQLKTNSGIVAAGNIIIPFYFLDTSCENFLVRDYLAKWSFRCVMQSLSFMQINQ